MRPTGQPGIRNEPQGPDDEGSGQRTARSDLHPEPHDGGSGRPDPPRPRPRRPGRARHSRPRAGARRLDRRRPPDARAGPGQGQAARRARPCLQDQRARPARRSGRADRGRPAPVGARPARAGGAFGLSDQRFRQGRDRRSARAGTFPAPCRRRRRGRQPQARPGLADGLGRTRKWVARAGFSLGKSHIVIGAGPRECGTCCYCGPRRCGARSPRYRPVAHFYRT